MKKLQSLKTGDPVIIVKSKGGKKVETIRKIEGVSARFIRVDDTPYIRKCGTSMGMDGGVNYIKPYLTESEQAEKQESLNERYLSALYQLAQRESGISESRVERLESMLR